MPDPEIERNKEVIVYDPTIHDYSEDKPEFHEIKEGHFVWANQKELAEYKAILK